MISKQISNKSTPDLKNIYILAFTLLVVMLGFGVVIPIMPYYIEEMGAGGTELGLLVASYAVMRLVFGPLWGSLSDRIGRKPVLMVGILGYGVTMILFGLATKLWMLFVFRILSGILSSATSPTTMAYIGDSTPENERGSGMGVLGAAIGIGTIIGPGLGGFFASNSLSTPFFIAGGMSILALIFTWLFLPESLPISNRKQVAAKNTFLNDAKAAVVSPIGGLLVMAFLISFAMTTFYSVFGLYALEKYSYGPETVGIILMVVGLVSAITQGVLTGPATKKWGEARVIQLTLIATAIGFILITAANSLIPFICAIAVFALATSLMNPAVTALTSRVTTFEQGITMGISNGFMSLGRIVGPILAGLLFDINIELPNIMGGIVMLSGFLYAALGSLNTPSEKTAHQNL